MKLPYGESSFEKIRTKGYHYVDKTRYIELLETQPESYVMILRSRRFGKTLFCDMLGRYYDRRQKASRHAGTGGQGGDAEISEQ